MAPTFKVIPQGYFYFLILGQTLGGHSYYFLIWGPTSVLLLSSNPSLDLAPPFSTKEPTCSLQLSAYRGKEVCCKLAKWFLNGQLNIL